MRSQPDDMGMGPTEEHEPVKQVAVKRTAWVSIWTNLSTSVMQIVTGISSGSQGLIADGIHSLSDVVGDGVVLVAAKHSHAGADDQHHYGHHRYETAATLILGAILLAVAAGMVLAGARKLEHPELIPTVHILALWVALGVLVIKEVLFRYMLAIGKKVGSTMLVANAWHARSDAASSLVVAAGIVGNLLGYPLFDPLAAIVVGLIVGKMGWEFFIDAFHDLMDRSAGEEAHDGIGHTIMSVPGVLGFHDLRTRKSGDLILADVHLEVDGKMSVFQAHEIAESVLERVRAKHPVLHLLTHVDPAPPSCQ